VDPSWTDEFKLPKERGEDNFKITAIKAAFHKEASLGEFFIEFETQVWDNKLVQQFEAMGACSVSAITFAKNDGGASVANALYRIHKMGQRNNCTYEKGNMSATLSKLLAAKIAEEEKKEAETNKEFSEKTAAAMESSLNGIRTDMVEVKDNTSGIKCRVENIENKVGEVHGQMGEVRGEIGEIKGQVVDNNEMMKKNLETIKKLEGELAHKTKEVDRIEAVLGQSTKKYNRLNERNGDLYNKIEELEGEVVKLNGVCKEFEKERRSLLAQIDICETADNLKKLMADINEREQKRARA